jgi:hypothetical protein
MQRDIEARIYALIDHTRFLGNLLQEAVDGFNPPTIPQPLAVRVAVEFTRSEVGDLVYRFEVTPDEA